MLTALAGVEAGEDDQFHRFSGGVALQRVIDQGRARFSAMPLRSARGEHSMLIVRIILWVVVAAIAIGALANKWAFVYLAPERATRWAIDAERKRAGLARKQIDLPGGLHYVYLEGRSGEPLLLLHGFGADKDNFTRVARFLTPHYRVIAPDHIGFGESAHPQDADYAPTAHRTATEMQALQAKRAANSRNTLPLGRSERSQRPADAQILRIRCDPARHSIVRREKTRHAREVVLVGAEAMQKKQWFALTALQIYIVQARRADRFACARAGRACASASIAQRVARSGAR